MYTVLYQYLCKCGNLRFSLIREVLDLAARGFELQQKLVKAVYFTLILAPKMGTLVLSGGIKSRSSVELRFTDDDTSTPKEWTTHVSFLGEEQHTLLIYPSCCLLMYLTISCDITMFWQRFTRTLKDGIDNMVNFSPIKSSPRWPLFSQTTHTLFNPNNRL